MSGDLIARLRGWQREMERSCDELRKLGPGMEDAAMGNAHVAETLEAAADEIEKLTAQVARLRLDLEAKDCLADGQYKAGVKAGWNLCVADDSEGLQRITGNTEHIAELKRINELRATFPEPTP